ncbi:MAG: response regulator transcription factor [Anaerolineales bacterium]
MIKIIIVDDNPSFLKRVKDFLVTCEECEVIGEASDGEGAISLALDLSPDLVLLDVRMGGMNGLNATQRLRDELPDVAIIILSKYDLHEYREAARIRGANGYVVKMNMVEDLLPTIQQVMAEQVNGTEREAK